MANPPAASPPKQTSPPSARVVRNPGVLLPAKNDRAECMGVISLPIDPHYQRTKLLKSLDQHLYMLSYSINYANERLEPQGFRLNRRDESILRKYLAKATREILRYAKSMRVEAHGKPIMQPESGVTVMKRLRPAQVREILKQEPRAQR